MNKMLLDMTDEEE